MPTELMCNYEKKTFIESYTLSEKAVVLMIKYMYVRDEYKRLKMKMYYIDDKTSTKKLA